MYFYCYVIRNLMWLIQMVRLENREGTRDKKKLFNFICKLYIHMSISWIVSTIVIYFFLIIIQFMIGFNNSEVYWNN